MRSSWILWTIFTICILVTHSCLRIRTKGEFTGIYEDKACSKQLNEDTNLPKINVGFFECKTFKKICINDVKLVIYLNPNSAFQDVFLDEFYDVLIRKTNETIRKELTDYFVSANDKRSVTNYYFIKVLEQMSYDNQITLNNDYILQHDIVCHKSYDKSVHMGQMFENSIFTIIILKVEILNNYFILKVHYIV